MNEPSLKIHSFLMHNAIPFQRYCHAECLTDAQWQSAVKKMNIKCAAAQTTVLARDDGTLLFLLRDFSEPESPNAGGLAVNARRLSPAQQEELFQPLRCTARTVSPLSLVFPCGKKCFVAASTALLKKDRWCFPCADFTESVVLSTKAFCSQFVPAAGIEFLR